MQIDLNFSYSETEETFIEEMMDVLVEKNSINADYYNKYDVKRGLRNSNGTGVLVGLTQIGNVVGYDVKDDKIVPIPGKLYYRGVDIEDIVNNCLKEDRFGYAETVYLLLFGTLPTKAELSRFESILAERRDLPYGFIKDMILTAPSKDIMNKMARSILALYSYDENPDDTSIKNVLRQSIDLIARLPIIAGYGFQARQRCFNNGSLHLHYPDPEMSTAENLLKLTRDNGEFTKLEATLLDIMLIIHAEHGGGNNSAFTTHVVSSTGTDTYSVIAAAIGSLKGPKHGGACSEVIMMIKDLKKHVPDITDHKAVEQHLIKLLKKEAWDKTGLVYGFGHAVYTISDPRAVVLKELARKLAIDKGLEDEFALYDFMEKRVPELFLEIKGSDKTISPNVDLFSGFVYSALGIPDDLLTPLFATSRITGWCAHRLEELIAGGRIMRPAYKCVQENIPYTPLDQR